MDVGDGIEACAKGTIPLNELPPGCQALIIAQNVQGLLGKRLYDLGFTPMTETELIRKGPKGNLIAVSIRNTVIALRSREARGVLVSPRNLH